MQTKKIFLLSLVLMTTSMAVHADAATYFGLDFKHRIMKGKKADSYDTRKVLVHDYPGAVFYVGRRFDNDVGLSLGIEQSKLVSKNYIFAANEAFSGPLQKAGDMVRIENKMQALHFDLNGFYEVNSHVEAIGQLGVALMRAKMDATVIASGVATNMQPSRRYRLIPRVGLGLQYIGKRRVGIRGLVNWEGTHSIRMKLRDDDGVTRSIRPFKHSLAFSLGLVFKI